MAESAERILFEVGQGTVTMTTQISFSGPAADFAWILPLAEVPDPDSLAVFSQQSLNTLETNSAPSFVPACTGSVLGVPCQQCAQAGGGSVDVYLRAEVGAYDVSVVGSEDPTELVRWLRGAGYRITPRMEPYLAAYGNEGMKFLALKLAPTAGVEDLRPFRFSVPGSTPSIPLRITALAAEPEMSVLAFVLGAQRYEGKNWPNLEIPDEALRYSSFSGPVQTNWSTLVARAVDDAGGQGWVTEYAGPSAGYAEALRSQLEEGTFPTPEARQSAQELLRALDAHPYLTRLSTRLSAEEMTIDPVLGPSALGEVSGQHQLLSQVAGVEQCSDDVFSSSDRCDFTTCGAAGLCRTTNTLGTDGEEATGCACLPGATARTTLAPDGSPSVICQDARLSFLNPGDRETADFETLPDVCAGFSCGDHGRCVTMNLTPTCICDQGSVATGSLAQDGTLQTTCVEPREEVPPEFYQGRLPALPELLPGGRELSMPARPPVRDDTTDVPGVPSAGQMPGAALGGSGCQLSVPRSGAHPRWLALGVLAAGLRSRRRRATPRTLRGL